MGFVLFFWLLFFFEKVSLVLELKVDQAGLELRVEQAGLELAVLLLPLSPEYWDCR